MMRYMKRYGKGKKSFNNDFDKFELNSSEKTNGYYDPFKDCYDSENCEEYDSAQDDDDDLFGKYDDEDDDSIFNEVFSGFGKDSFDYNLEDEFDAFGDGDISKWEVSDLQRLIYIIDMADDILDKYLEYSSYGKDDISIKDIDIALSKSLIKGESDFEKGISKRFFHVLSEKNISVTEFCMGLMKMFFNTEINKNIVYRTLMSMCLSGREKIYVKNHIDGLSLPKR